jgi:hypothetical protein
MTSFVLGVQSVGPEKSAVRSVVVGSMWQSQTSRLEGRLLVSFELRVVVVVVVCCQ